MGEVEGAATPPKPKKRAGMMTIYNGSLRGHDVGIHNGLKLKPGCCAKVPYPLGKKLVDSVPYIKRAERGDPMDC